MDVRRRLRTLPTKLYLILAALMLFVFFSNDFGLADVQKTAVILAAGLDRAEAGFELTAQISVPKGSDRTTGGTSSVEICATGATVSDCVTSLHAKTGWVPKLVFCELLLIGEELAKDDVFRALDYFLRNEYMPDSCRVAVCAGTAKEVLSSQSAIDDVSSLAIGTLFSDSARRQGRVMVSSLNEFAVGYHGVSKSGYLPFVRAKPQQGPQDAGGSGPFRGAAGAFGTEERIYVAEETAIFSEGKMVGLLTPEQTFAFSLLGGNVFAGTFSVEEEDGKFVTLTVLTDDGRVSPGKELPKADVSLRVTVRLCCRGVASSVEEIADDAVPEETAERARLLLEGYARSLFAVCKESGCDLFFLLRDLYRSSPARYEAWKDRLPAAVEPVFDTVVSSKA